MSLHGLHYDGRKEVVQFQCKLTVLKAFDFANHCLHELKVFFAKSFSGTS